MIYIPYSATVTISEEYFRDICVNAIADVFCDETNEDFVEVVSAEDRKAIYMKVGMALIDYAKSEVIK